MDTSLVYAAEWKGETRKRIMFVTGHEIKIRSEAVRTSDNRIPKKREKGGW
jgi:hypothetical protein